MIAMYVYDIIIADSLLTDIGNNHIIESQKLIDGVYYNYLSFKDNNYLMIYVDMLGMSADECDQELELLMRNLGFNMSHLNLIGKQITLLN